MNGTWEKFIEAWSDIIRTDPKTTMLIEWFDQLAGEIVCDDGVPRNESVEEWKQRVKQTLDIMGIA